MGQVRYAPTQVLPCIEVEVGTGPGTNYPFGKFDLNTRDGCRKFDLFSALSARVKEWTIDITATYHSRRNHSDPPDPPVFDEITAHTTGGGPLPTEPIALGPADVELGDVSFNGEGPGAGIVWNNPHDGFREFEALNAGYIVSFPDFIEENFILPDVRLVNAGGHQTDPQDTATHSNQDGPSGIPLKVSVSGAMTYNRSEPYVDADGVRGPLYYHSYRNRDFGYVALAFNGGLVIYDMRDGLPLHGGWEFQCSTHLGALRGVAGQPFRGPIGTFTITWPNPLTNEPLSVSCPIFGIPISSESETLEYSFSAVATPSKCYRYDDIFADDGTSNRDPTQ